MAPTNTEIIDLRKRILKSVAGLLVLQSLKKEPLPKSKVLDKVGSKFDIQLYPALHHLQKERLVSNAKDTLALTKRGERIRQKLVEDYLGLQKVIKQYLQ